MVLILPLPDPNVETSSRVLDSQDRVVTWLFRERRDPVPLEEMPGHLKEAVVAMEDTRFYRHPGVDPVGIARSLVANIRHGRVVAGGSTITQQLARNLYLEHTVTLYRKVAEALLALKLEAHLSKAEILEMYLNQIYWGHGAYGAEMAAQTYFGKSVRHLTLAESALLAAVIASPENYSPYRDPDRTLALREIVLERMVEQEFITPAEAEEAAQEPLILAGLEAQETRVAPRFVDWILSDLDRRFPGLSHQIWEGGYTIRTTLDLDLQLSAEEALNRRLGWISGEREESGRLQPQGALVALDSRTGAVRAMVGGRQDPGDHLNRAVSKRQPGSAFKVFAYTEALRQNHTIIETQKCEPISVGGYEPACHIREGFHFRDLDMREAVAVSCNVTAVLWGQEVGTARVASRARDMGVESHVDPHAANLVLGAYEVTPLEMAAAYIPLATGGLGGRPYGVVEVVAPGGRVIFSDQPRTRQVLDPGVAYLVTSLLQEVLRTGTGSHLGPQLGFPAAGKTGTTDGSRDAWFVGYTPDLVSAVWVGYDIPRALPGVGGTLAGPIWAEFMSSAQAAHPSGDFVRPDSVVAVEICEESGLLAHGGCPSRTELFLRDTEPRDICPLPHRQEDDPFLPWLPFRFEPPPLGDQEEREPLEENDPGPEEVDPEENREGNGALPEEEESEGSPRVR